MGDKLLKHYSQVDQSWNSRVLNKQPFGKVGCLVCSLAMKVQYETQNPLATPIALDEYLDNNKGYLWSSDTMIWDAGFKWAKSMGCSYTKMDKINVFGVNLISVDVQTPCIMEVTTARKTTHFVLLIDKELGLILDPGTKKSNPLNYKESQYTPKSIRLLK